MSYANPDITSAREKLRALFDSLENKRAILRAPELKQLYEQIKTLPADQRKTFGAEVNTLKGEVEAWIDDTQVAQDERPSIDVTAPFDVNVPVEMRPRLLDARSGSTHPISKEIERISGILERMGFEIWNSRELDDDFHMFESLNFPPGHPARDDFDTFMTTEGLVAPAHTSTMQHRALKSRKHLLAEGRPIMIAVPDRVFRNEDLDATHEHTFYQHEGIMVGRGITVGNLIATLKAFMSEYFEENLQAKIQPFYFPFTEPSFEFALERPSVLRKGDTEADRWLELLGCGMIHPNVLIMAGIDAKVYTGFAWGGGIERLIMMRYGIEDIRHFQSGKLEFLRQF